MKIRGHVLLLIASLGYTAVTAQGFYVERAQFAFINSGKLEKENYVENWDTVHVTGRGFAVLRDSSGYVFILHEGTHPVTSAWQLALKDDARVDSLTKIFFDYGLTQCEPQSELKIKLRVKKMDDSSFVAEWNGPSADSYILVGMNEFEDILFIEKKSAASHRMQWDFVSQPVLVLKVYTQACDASETVLLRIRKGKLTIGGNR